MRWPLVLVVLFVTGCPPSKIPTKAMTDCSAAISAFASVDPPHLRGLSATCTLADLSAVLKQLDGSTRGLLGNDGSAFDIRLFSSAKLEEIHAWIDSKGTVALLDADKPPGTEAAFLAALGEPEARFDYAWGTGGTLQKAELVWPAKGVVLVSSGHVTGLVRLGVFAPTTLADYQARLRYEDIETEERE